MIISDAFKEKKVDKFVDSMVITGVFRTLLSSYQAPGENISLNVFLVVAEQNDYNNPNYDESVKMISGTYYEIIFNGKVYKKTFKSEVKAFVKFLMMGEQTIDES